jgi:hypothetical protein
MREMQTGIELSFLLTYSKYSIACQLLKCSIFDVTDLTSYHDTIKSEGLFYFPNVTSFKLKVLLYYIYNLRKLLLTYLI